MDRKQNLEKMKNWLKRNSREDTTAFRFLVFGLFGLVWAPILWNAEAPDAFSIILAWLILTLVTFLLWRLGCFIWDSIKYLARKRREA